MSDIKTVQQFGQVRLPRKMLQDCGQLVTLTLCSEGLLITPFSPTDRDGPDRRVCKIYNNNRVCLPIKLRRAAGIGEKVRVEELESGAVLICPENGGA